jgi:Viral BACON domain
MVLRRSSVLRSTARILHGGAFAVLCFVLAVARPLQAADIEFVTEELPWAIADKPYSPPPLEVRSSGKCPLGGVGFSVVGGELPPGLELSRLGYFSGTPLRTGDFGFGIRVSNGCTWTAKRFTLTVTGAPIITASPEQLRFVGAGEKTLHVSATWPLLRYAATSSADWLKVAPAHGFTPRPSSALAGDYVVVTADPSSLKPGHYSAKITFTAWQALEVPSVALELDVIAKPESSGTPTSVSP